ncbi:unnamed protein product [Protopolystoma xenopodis]|uniref:Tyrosine-protein kinase ephrin type A/B receptor-like domain-containing protein n=1 Tax=Protopolystoma xenopodis TaxID=117903 RepID=A0A3S5AV38_9PLAT|nr:unnamed protein product [Protopolystoma xenopodis]
MCNLTHFQAFSSRCVEVPTAGRELASTGDDWVTVSVSLPKGHAYLIWFMYPDLFSWSSNADMKRIYLKKIVIHGEVPGDGCFPCPSGTYSNRNGSAACQKCPRNTFSVSGSTTCTNCSSNEYSGKLIRLFASMNIKVK